MVRGREDQKLLVTWGLQTDLPPPTPKDCGDNQRDVVYTHSVCALGSPHVTGHDGPKKGAGMLRTGLRASVVTVALTASMAHANTSMNFDGFAGWQDLGTHHPAQRLEKAINGSEGTAILGGDFLLDLSGLGLGLAVDKTVSGSAQPWAGSILGGLLLDFLPLRLELLGEVGRRATDFGDLFASNGSTFLGLRPGVSVRLAFVPIRVGLTALVRWPTSNGDIGSPDYGFVGKVGFEIP